MMDERSIDYRTRGQVWGGCLWFAFVIALNLGWTAFVVVTLWKVWRG